MSNKITFSMQARSTIQCVVQEEVFSAVYLILYFTRLFTSSHHIITWSLGIIVGPLRSKEADDLALISLFYLKTRKCAHPTSVRSGSDRAECVRVLRPQGLFVSLLLLPCNKSGWTMNAGLFYEDSTCYRSRKVLMIGRRKIGGQLET